MSRTHWMFGALLALPLAFAQDSAPAPSTPKPGDAAPVFRLNDHEGDALSVGGEREGKWAVVAFYPRAMTPG